MKKLPLYVFLSLMFCNVVNAKIIKLQKCYDTKQTMGVFEHWRFEKQEFVIDTNKEILTELYVYTDKQVKFLEERRKTLKGPPTEKIHIINYKITYMDDNYVKALEESKSKTNWSAYTVDLKKLEVHWTNSVLEALNSVHKCEIL